MFVNERGLGEGEILGSLVGSRSRVVEEVLWENGEGEDVFVDT